MHIVLCANIQEINVFNSVRYPPSKYNFALCKMISRGIFTFKRKTTYLKHTLFLFIKHSLYYIYTALSKPVDQPGIYQFTAMGLLDDREIDSYNSKEQKKIPRQQWMKEKMQEDYWEKGTQSRKSKEQWFNVNVDILMKRMRHNESDLHVLQWRHGCEIEKQGDEVKFSKGIDEYSYDGENFLSFDDKESQWVASVDAALPTKRKWDNVPILNQYTKGYLEKECVDWLNKFREYEDLKLRNGSPPDVHVFAKRSFSDKTKLRLTCLATGFYHKDTFLTIRKYCSPLPEDELESTGIRPNHDETFQLRKSVEISEDEKADFDCFVAQRTLKGPIIVRWGSESRSSDPQRGVDVFPQQPARISSRHDEANIILFCKAKAVSL
uniref:Immunoglobulin C1-set domain-containing protein n=1 Tax=Cyprinus carpio TaxID=7962 RepID=A0A8C1S2J2_CYPCA